MRRRRTIGLVAGLLATAAVVSIRPSMAQMVSISAEETTLVSALDVFSKRTGINVVYADRVVSGQTASCRYEGTNAAEALACILDGTEVKARWTRENQVVLLKRHVDPIVEISGRVIDAETKEPLPGAHVILLKAHLGVVSDEFGRYRIDGAQLGSERLLISHLGYESKEIDLGARHNDEAVQLIPQTIEGAAVVVEDSRFTQDDALSGSDHASVESVKSHGFGLDYSNVATEGTAPYMSRTGEISGPFIVRGGLPDQNVFKLEGAPVYQPWHAQGLFSILQPSTLGGVRLFTGPLPADQGGYLASLLDAELSTGGQYASGAASITSTVGEAAVSTPLGSGITAMIAARRSHAGLNRTYSLSLPNNQNIEGGSFYDLAAKIGVRSSPNNQYTFTVYRGYDDLSWSAGGNRTEDPRADQWSNGVYSFRHRYLGEDRLMVTNTVFVSTFDALSEVAPVPDRMAEKDDSRQVRDAGLKINVDYQANESHALKTGVEFSQHHLEWSDQRNPGSYLDDVMEGAMFVQDTWSLSDRLLIRPGLRLSWFGNGVGMEVEPRFHGMLAVSSATSLHAAWARQVQYLHQISDISSGALGSSIRSWLISSNNTVAPATGHQVNVGVSSKAGPRWTLGADLYWRDFENVFLPRDRLASGFPFAVTTYNRTEGFTDFGQGSSTAYGVELSARYVNDWFAFSTSYTGSRSLFRVPSEVSSDRWRPGVYDIPHMVRLSTGYHGPQLSLIISGEARTGYPTLATIRGTGHQIGGDRLPTYFRLDAAVGYQFSYLGFDWRIQGRVFNLTDRENVIGYEYDRDLLYLRRNSLLGVTRWPTLNIQVSW